VCGHDAVAIGDGDVRDGVVGLGRHAAPFGVGSLCGAHRDPAFEHRHRLTSRPRAVARCGRTGGVTATGACRRLAVHLVDPDGAVAAGKDKSRFELHGWELVVRDRSGRRVVAGVPRYRGRSQGIAAGSVTHGVVQRSGGCRSASHSAWAEGGVDGSSNGCAESVIADEESAGFFDRCGRAVVHAADHVLPVVGVARLTVASRCGKWCKARWWMWGCGRTDGDLAVAGWGGMKLRSEYPGTTDAAGRGAMAWTLAGDPRAARGGAGVAPGSERWEVVEVRSMHRSGVAYAERSRMGIVTRARESLAVTAASAVAAVALFLLT